MGFFISINTWHIVISQYHKILIYKKKRRKGYQRKNGHRQGVTLLEVVKIDAKSPAKPKKKEEK